MDGLDRDTALRLERLRYAWEYNVQEAVAHRQFFFQVFGFAATGAAATVASALVGQLQRDPAVLLVGTFAAVAGVAVWRLRQVPKRLGKSLHVILRTIARLMAMEDE